MEKRYNVYFAGEILEGFEAGQVRAGLAALFKADEATLQKLFSGKAQLIKKSCDKPTALKYKQAMEKAGARPVVKALQAETEAPSSPSPAAAPPAQTTADRIAALASAPDAAGFAGRDQPPPASTNGQQPDSLDLCPEGTEVLRTEERATPVESDIDTTALAVDAAAQRLSEEAPPPPPAPDTQHLAMGEVGDTIPNLPAEQAALNPDIGGIDLSPEGTDFSDCKAPEPAEPAIDLSGMDLAPPGTEVLREEERKPIDAVPEPATDHLDLAD